MLCWFLGGWFCVCSRTLWVSPTNCPVRLVVYSIATTPTGFYSQRFLRLCFPMLEPWVVWSVSLPSCSSQFIRMWIAQLASSCLSHPVLQPPPCHKSSLPSYTALPLLLVWMNVSSLTPWLLDCHRLIFCQFWLVFVFKFVVVLLLVVRGGTACLPTPPPWPNVLSFQFIFLGIDFTYFI